jgi:hypothetical protein
MQRIAVVMASWSPWSVAWLATRIRRNVDPAASCTRTRGDAG